MMFWNALRAGEVLTNPEKWKDLQNLINSIVAVIGLLLWIASKAGFNLELSGEEIAVIAAGIATTMGIFNRYMTTATTNKIGILPAKIEGD